MSLYKFTILALLLTKMVASKAATVDTLVVYSNNMHKNVKCVLILPTLYSPTSKALPVLYLLHGYSGNYSNWVKKVPDLKTQADALQIIIVCPDGGYSSWYLDSPIDSTYQYETFISKELVYYIDTKYNTIKNNTGRALSGLSMGGHGGIYVGLKHPTTFGAIGSMSGALDVTYIKSRYEVEKRLGDTLLQAANWKSHSLFAMIDTMKLTNQKIIIDCGVDDFVLPFNETIHSKMIARRMKHDYILRPGKHEWSYWGNAVVYQLLFFKRYFDENKNKITL